MSTYEVSPAHIRFLVDLGRELSIGFVVADGKRLQVDLADFVDRQLVGSSLLGANRLGNWPEDAPEVARLFDARSNAARPSTRTLEDLVQALQWVRSYCYQACRSPDWPTSTACRYTDQLRDAIEARIIGLFDTKWDFTPNV
jgi:hypothetical protein